MTAVADEKKNETEAQALQNSLKDVVENGAVTTDNGDHTIHCLTVIGQIEGHYALAGDNKTTKYEHVIPQLVAVEESRDIEGLLVILNTVGGDIEAGLALAELIAGMQKPTVSLVLGGGHSIGVPLAVAAKRSFIVPSATMTVHPVRINGLVLGVPQAFSYFRKMQQRITDFVTAHSHMSNARFMELCMATDELATDIGTVLDGAAYEWEKGEIQLLDQRSVAREIPARRTAGRNTHSCGAMKDVFKKERRMLENGSRKRVHQTKGRGSYRAREKQ